MRVTRKDAEDASGSADAASAWAPASASPHAHRKAAKRHERARDEWTKLADLVSKYRPIHPTPPEWIEARERATYHGYEASRHWLALEKRA
jgi:hypothetical protein